MARGFKFTLVAHSFNGIQKPFSVTLPEGDNRITTYNNGSFKREIVDIPVPVKQETKSKSGTKTGHENPNDLEGFDLLLSNFKQNIQDGLKGAGFTTVESVAESTKEDLMLIKGIGEDTAIKIIGIAKSIQENQE